MTAYLVFGAIKDGRLSLDKAVVINDEIGEMKSGGPRMFLQPGTSVTVQQLIDGLIVQGSDDAALALALTVSGNEKTFVDLMNREAVRLGMNRRILHHHTKRSIRTAIDTQ